MKPKNFLPYFIVGFIFMYTSLSLFAHSNTRSIKGKLHANLNYTLNGNPLLKEIPTITYKGEVYPAITDLLKTLGYDVTMSNGNINITSSPSLNEEPGPVILPNPTETNTPYLIFTVNGNIVGVNYEAKTITLIPQVPPNASLVPITLYLTPHTLILNTENNPLPDIFSLTIGRNVSVQYKNIPIGNSTCPQAIQVNLL